MFDRRGNLPPGPGPGRPKGSKTKRKPATSVQLLDLLAEHDYDPVVEQINLARDPDTPAGTKAKINMELMKLIYPAVKAVEHSGSVEHRAFQMTWDMTAAAGTVAPQALEHAVTIDITPDAKKAAQGVLSGPQTDGGDEEF